MTNSRSHGAVVLSLSLLLLSACATEETMTGGGSTPSSSAAMKASAQAYDSLQSCLARIQSGGTRPGTAGTRQLAEEGCQRDEALRQSIAGNATAKSGNRAAAGAAGDSLEACMARIPKDGSVGQRMLAEESCQRDQANRR